MSLRRAGPLAVALGLAACTPSVTENRNPQFLDYAVFDPSGVPPAIPTPNDIALASLANPATAPGGALGELLRAFAAAGGFPNDQEVPVVFDLVRTPIGGTPATPAPDLAVGGVIFCNGANQATCNVLVLQVVGTTPTILDETKVDLVYTTSGTKGTLTIRNKPDATTESRRWKAGAKYIVALRGGMSGLATSTGVINPQPAMFLLLQGKDLTKAENQTLFTAEQKAAGAPALLEQIRQSYLAAFQLIDLLGFPHGEIADLTAFTIAPDSGKTFVEVDESAGVVPLPSDLILDSTTGLVANNPAFCQGAFDQTNPPSCPLSRGLAKLDGFSTTAMILAHVGVASGAPAAVTASTVNPLTVFLFKLTSTGAVQLCDLRVLLGGGSCGSMKLNYVSEPSAIVSGGISPVIGLAPAVNASGAAFLPPLEQGTEYAVIITKNVKDATTSCSGAPCGLVRSTVGTILLLDNPIFSGGQSQLEPFGVSDAQAQGLESMRLGVAAAVQAAGLTKDQVAMGYTFRTQSITGPALALAGLSANTPDAAQSATKLTPHQAERKYGLITGFLSAQPIDSVIEAQIQTYDLLDPASGAFRTDPASGQLSSIRALVAVPSPVPSASSPAPLVIFHHGLLRARADMLLIAGRLAQAGMVVATVDSVKHGDRSFCSAIHLFQPGSATPTTPVQAYQCAAGATTACANSPNVECAQALVATDCVPDATLATQGDLPPTIAAGGLLNGPLPQAYPGHCMLHSDHSQPGALANLPLDATLTASICANDTNASTNCWLGQAGVPLASAEYFVSGNLFRTRDSVRQDIIDQGVLLRTLTSAAGKAKLAAALGVSSLGIDDTRVFYVSQSGGSIEGVLDLAVIPAFSKAVLNAGGGTLIDILTTSFRLRPQFTQLQNDLGLLSGTTPVDPATYGSGLLQFISVGKWVLDPADPINFAAFLASPLPGQTPKTVLGQAARCDDFVPDATHQLYYALMGLGPTDPLATSATPSLQWFMTDTNDSCPQNGSTGAGGATHAFLLDFVNASLTAKAQNDVANFLLANPLANATPVLP